jgi:DNA-binding transcriptional MocR family regulator
MAPLRAITVMASPVTAALATLWINDGTAEAALSAIRRASHIRQEDAAHLLSAAHYVSKPDAFHLWLSVPAPWTRLTFAKHLRENGVGVVASDACTVSGMPPEAVRVCMGGAADRTDCRHMLELIADALVQSPSSAEVVP